MKILCVSSPHGYTTRDVWMRIMKGLRLNGVDVVPYDLTTRWQVYETLFQKAGRKITDNLPDGFAPSLLAYEPITGAAIYHDVDAVLVVSPQYMPIPIVDILRRAGKATIGVFTEAPYEDTLHAPIQAAHFDFVFVNDKYSVTLYQSFNERTFYLPHSYDPDIHFDDDQARADNVVFIGTGYKTRVDFLNSVDWEGTGLELYGIWWMNKRHRLHRYLRGELVENEETAALYRRAGVGISAHRTMRYVNYDWQIDPGEAYSVGPRTYELAACGLFQVSDYRPELIDIFGDTVPVFESARDLRRIVQRAIDDPVWRQEMAKKQHEAVQGHTSAARMSTLLEKVA